MDVNAVDLNSYCSYRFIASIPRCDTTRELGKPLVCSSIIVNADVKEPSIGASSQRS